MILQSLVNYYDVLHEINEIEDPGWCSGNVSFALVISLEGDIKGVIPLKTEMTIAKKKIMRPQQLTVPEMITRANEISANFLCDHSAYFLGVNVNGMNAKTKKSFEAAREKHIGLLKNVNCEFAMAILAFFNKWNPENAKSHPVLCEIWEDITDGGNLIFEYKGEYAQEDYDIANAWNQYWKTIVSDVEGICLVTGEKTHIARTHPNIRGIAGSQTSGAKLVSFNETAFESYGKEQSYNASIGKYATFKYVSALKHLIKNHDYTKIGDTTIFYWAEDGDEDYSNTVNACANPDQDNQRLVKGVFDRLSQGKVISIEGVEKNLSFDQRFYILGIAPNAARLSIRFFYQNKFGNILYNLKAHYERMEIVKPSYETLNYLGVWRLLQETVNKNAKDKKPHSNMASAVFKAIISNSKYPEALYQGVMNRIRLEQDNTESHTQKITHGRAAIIKSYLLKNTNVKKEEISMALNEPSNHVAYVLGREFAILEEIQEIALGTVNASIKDRFFNSACATPASIFPILLKLKNSHMRKTNDNVMLEKHKIYLERTLGELQNKLDFLDQDCCAYPRRLSLEDQGIFILGYYHQNQKRYEKKNREDENDVNN